MTALHAAPEDASKDLTPSGRSNEIGDVQRELAHMQAALSAALMQKDCLSELGIATARDGGHRQDACQPGRGPKISPRPPPG